MGVGVSNPVKLSSVSRQQPPKKPRQPVLALWRLSLPLSATPPSAPGANCLRSLSWFCGCFGRRRPACHSSMAQRTVLCFAYLISRRLFPSLRFTWQAAVSLHSVHPLCFIRRSAARRSAMPCTAGLLIISFAPPAGRPSAACLYPRGLTAAAWCSSAFAFLPQAPRSCFLYACLYAMAFLVQANKKPARHLRLRSGAFALAFSCVRASLCLQPAAPGPSLRAARRRRRFSS